MIRYVKGDATKPIGEGAKVIVHCCNDTGAWGAGFVVALSKRWRTPEREYRAWHERGMMGPVPFELGQIQTIEVGPDLYVCNLIGQSGIRYDRGVPPIRYEAIQAGLRWLKSFCVEYRASVHMPRMGAGLAGGDWAKIAASVGEELDGIDVTVYDLEG